MRKKSLFELEIVKRCVHIRTQHKKSQSYIAMLLDVSDGYIGHVENPFRPEMYTHDQINAIALDLNESIHEFYPEKAIIQELPKRDLQQSSKRADAIKNVLVSLVNEGFFKTEKSVGDIIIEIIKNDQLVNENLTNKDITDQARPLVKQGLLKCKRISNKNFYSTP